MHEDRTDTHIISAIINVDQDHDWPLFIQCGRDAPVREVVMKKGDMLFYESARCLQRKSQP